MFDGAATIRVPRARFAPVKKTDDLLVVRSDAYQLGEDFTVRLARESPPLVRLDPDHFKLVGDFEQRFSQGPPSLVECERLTVEGDVSFGRDVKVRGQVTVKGPRHVADGELLEA